jgi:hypothetical protein
LIVELDLFWSLSGQNNNDDADAGRIDFGGTGVLKEEGR